MAEIGIQPHVIEAILNHVSGHKSGVAGIYNRASYEAEKATALNLWAAHILALVERRESNIVTAKRPLICAHDKNPWKLCGSFSDHFGPKRG